MVATDKQKKIMQKAGYDPKLYEVVNEDNITLTIKHKETQKRKVIIK